MSSSFFIMLGAFFIWSPINTLPEHKVNKTKLNDNRSSNNKVQDTTDWKQVIKWVELGSKHSTDQDMQAHKRARNARLRGLLPRVSLKVGTNSNLVIRELTDSYVTNQGQTLGFDAAMTFELGRLLYTSVETQEARAYEQRIKEREEKKAKALKLFFELKKLNESDPDLSPDPNVVHIRKQEISAELDLLTNGRFLNSGGGLE